jgi:hypothetical protein
MTLHVYLAAIFGAEAHRVVKIGRQATVKMLVRDFFKRDRVPLRELNVYAVGSANPVELNKQQLLFACGLRDDDTLVIAPEPPPKVSMWLRIVVNPSKCFIYVACRGDIRVRDLAPIIFPFEPGAPPPDFEIWRSIGSLVEYLPLDETVDDLELAYDNFVARPDATTTDTASD